MTETVDDYSADSGHAGDDHDRVIRGTENLVVIHRLRWLFLACAG